MRVADLVRVMEAIAPPALAEPWDKTGLLVGSERGPLRRLALAIDATPEVVAECVRARTDTLVCYHPPIFAPIERLTDASPAGSRALALAAAGVAVYSPHTALDSAEGGLNEFLGSLLGEGWMRPVSRAATHRPDEACKITTYVPAAAADAVREAMSAAGAGRIGGYSRCSFAAPGEGTFRGGAGTSPAVGRRGRLERVAEVRLEMPSSLKALPAALAALRASHPYEEPPIEVHPLFPQPSLTEGSGRIVELARPTTAASLAARLARALPSPLVQRSALPRAARAHRVVGVCAGSGGALVEAAAQAGATLFVTGEMKHHDVLDAHARGVEVILAGHSQTERCYLPTLARRLRKALPGVAIRTCRADRAPLL